MDMSVIEDRKTRARAWFEALRNEICAAFERLEDDAPASLYPGDAGRFVRVYAVVACLGLLAAALYSARIGWLGAMTWRM